jgi:hypothetical protein
MRVSRRPYGTVGLFWGRVPRISSGAIFMSSLREAFGVRGLPPFDRKNRRMGHPAIVLDFCTCSHRGELLSIFSVGDPGRDWTFISGLAGRCSIQLSYGATFETPGIPRPWRLRFDRSVPQSIAYSRTTTACAEGGRFWKSGKWLREAKQPGKSRSFDCAARDEAASVCAQDDSLFIRYLQPR